MFSITLHVFVFCEFCKFFNISILIFQPQNIRLRVIGRLKSLTLLDGSAVTEHEATAALRVAAGSRICQLSLLTHARVDSHKPRSLSLMPTAEILEKQSHHRPEKLGETDTHWYQKVS